MAAGEVERLGEVGLAVSERRDAVRADLEHDVTLVAGVAEPAEQLGARLRAAAGDEVLVRQARLGAVAQVHVRQPVAERLGHGEHVGPGYGRVGDVERGGGGVHLDRVPVRGVGGDLGLAAQQRVEVLDREGGAALLGHLGDARLEVPGVLALPAERRMHDNDARAERLGQLARFRQLRPRVPAPDPLGDQQVRRVHGHDRDAVVVRQLAQYGGILADRICGHHDFEPVVAEPGRGLEGVRSALREDRGGRQRDLDGCHVSDLRNRLSFGCALTASLCVPARRAAEGRPTVGTSRYVPSMPRSATATAFECSACGWRTRKWAGRCGDCGAWGTVAEGPGEDLGRATSRAQLRPAQPATAAVPIGQVDAAAARARPTGMSELDRVLGGGLVPGAVVLLAGEPGVGKSTLLLEAGALAAASGRVLYVTGEESAAQVRLRADRIGAISDSLYLAAETDFGALLGHVQAVDPALLIVDSVQTINAAGVDGVPGGVTQIREITAALTALAKQRTLTTVLVGHVTKDGSVAGPRTLEHLVDVVLHFDGDSRGQLRMVRALKNRFGPTDEFGCFELGEFGLVGAARSERPVPVGAPRSGARHLRDGDAGRPAAAARRGADAGLRYGR